MEDKHQIKNISELQKDLEVNIEKWRNVPGDIDDFIFYQEEYVKNL